MLEMEAGLDRLIAELCALGDDTSLDLASRLNRCQTERRARAAHLTQTGRYPAVWPYRCHSSACWSCRRAILRTWRERASLRFAEADNEDTALITLSLARLGDLCDLPAVVNKLRRDLRNMRDAMAGRSAAWGSVMMMGFVELDAVDPEEVVLLGGGRRAAIPSLPAIGGQPDETLWIPHAHLCVHHPHIDRRCIRQAFEEQWKGTCRVDLRAFHADVSADVNAANCVSYALKFHNSTTYAEAQTADWSMHLSATMWSWLHSRKRGLQPLQVRIGARAGLSGSATHNKLVASMPPAGDGWGSYAGTWVMP